jgi:hypothetical protein
MGQQQLQHAVLMEKYQKHFGAPQQEKDLVLLKQKMVLLVKHLPSAEDGWPRVCVTHAVSLCQTPCTSGFVLDTKVPFCSQGWVEGWVSMEVSP